MAALLGAAACGGDDAPMAPVGGGSAGGASGDDGSAGGASGDAGGPQTMLVPSVMYGDFEGSSVGDIWFLDGKMLAAEALDPPRDGSAHALHVQLMTPAGSDGRQVQTHIHTKLDTLYAGIQFWARNGAAAGDDVELMFALTSLVSADYWSELRAQRPWPVKRFHVGAAWSQNTIPFDTLATEGPGVPAMADGDSMLHFLFPGDAAYDVWIDDIAFFCKPPGCEVAAQ
jgi:hypothetical protein